MVKIKNSIIYINGPGYSYHHFEPLIDKVDQYFQHVLSTLHIVRLDGTPVNIELHMDVFNPEKIRASAYRVDREKGLYNITMTAGLSYSIWLASRTFEINYDFLPWLKRIKIKDPANRRIGRKKLIADLIYVLCSYTVILHEISHIILGHTDFLADKLGCAELDEFSEGDKKFSEKEYKIRNTFEAEADRQAISFLMIFVDEAMGPDGLGIDLRFPSRVMVFEFIVYALTVLTILLQQYGGTHSVHPSANERQYIFYSSVIDYLRKIHPDQAEIIEPKIYFWGMEAAQSLGLKNAGGVAAVINTALKIGKVDDVIKEFNLRSYLHRVDSKL